MTVKNDVVIIGAGPIGITTACVLKAKHPHLNITVLDRRKDPTRKHGLSINSDTISKIISKVSDPELKEIFKSWGNFARTNAIEESMTAYAKKHGITVCRGEEYGLNKGDLNKILKTTRFTRLSEKQKKLEPILKAASVIFAVDGAKSVVREELKIGITGEKTYQYMVEMKYQAAGNALPRGLKYMSKESVKTGHVAFEAVNRHPTADPKPATYFTFVEKDTFDKLRVTDTEGKVKGVYGNTWNLKDLEALGKTDDKIKKLHTALTRYLSASTEPVKNVEIATVELKIYQNTQSVKSLDGKPVVFIGDARSGLILQQGFNKGLKEVALVSDAFDKFLQNDPTAFIKYEEASQKLFEQERNTIEWKNRGIKLAQKGVDLSFNSSRKFEASSQKAQGIFSWFTSLFTKAH
ncbi:MAG: FAD-dependent oxidoreductase [Chlamydiales bacterium]|nr:FAD-dependent oxidoreductase [Chlamydiales bacterium]